MIPFRSSLPLACLGAQPIEYLGIKREKGVLRHHKPPRMECNFSSSCIPLPELQSCVQLLQLKQMNKTPWTHISYERDGKKHFQLIKTPGTLSKRFCPQVLGQDSSFPRGCWELTLALQQLLTTSGCCKDQNAPRAPAHTSAHHPFPSYSLLLNARWYRFLPVKTQTCPEVPATPKRAENQMFIEEMPFSGPCAKPFPVPLLPVIL